MNLNSIKESVKKGFDQLLTCGGKKQQIIDKTTSLKDQFKNLLLNDLFKEGLFGESDDESDEYIEVSICDSDCSDCFEYQK
jgi:hypothetical protein